MRLIFPEQGLEEATFFFHWPEGVGSVGIRLLNPSGVEVLAAEAEIFTTDTHKVYHLNNSPAPGTWRVEVDPTNDIELIGGLSARQRTGVQLLTTVTQIPTGGPLELVNTYGPFEWGVPVTVTAILTDEAGPILNADVSATVRLPDGTLACPLLRLRDDGTGGDDLAGDGVYAARFSNTSQAGSQFGVLNDDPTEPNPGGQSAPIWCRSKPRTARHRASPSNASRRRPSTSSAPTPVWTTPTAMACPTRGRTTTAPTRRR